MGLSRALIPGRLPLFNLLSTVAAALIGCVQVIEFDQGEEIGYLFVDGAVDVGVDVQRISIGRTTGSGSDGTEAIEGAAVRLFDLDADTEVNCRDVGEGDFECAVAGQFDHEYRLEIDLPELGTYVARSGPLAPADLDLDIEASLEVRRRPDGSEVEASVAVVDVLYTAPEELAWVLLTRPSFSWAYTDRATGGFDPALTCYFDEGPVAGFSVVDVERQAPGARTLTRAARIPLDFRTGGASVVTVEAVRVPLAARGYYRDLAVATDLSGSIFSERPYTTVGNVVSPEGAASMLGYFAVRDREELVVALTSDEIRRRTPPTVCAQFYTSFPDGIDCVNCLNSSAELYGPPSTVRPAWWP